MKLNIYLTFFPTPIFYEYLINDNSFSFSFSFRRVSLMQLI